MIGRITGIVENVGEDFLLVAVGPICYEVFVSPAVIQRVMGSGGTGTPVTLSTYQYLEGGVGSNSMLARLVGFLTPRDREFFQKFITVPGIGIKKAVKAMAAPTGEIAAAIENGDLRFLSNLPEIGKRTAEKIVAELRGRIAAFVSPADIAANAASKPSSAPAGVEGEVLAVLLQLGHRRSEAEQLIQSVAVSRPELKTAEEIIQEIYRMQKTGAGGK